MTDPENAFDPENALDPENDAGSENYTAKMDESLAADFSLTDFQSLIRRMYSSKDAARGTDGTFLWLMEEIGELAAALREGDDQETALEFADVLAWVVTLANVAGIDLQQAVLDKYGEGCPGCGRQVCVCMVKP